MSWGGCDYMKLGVEISNRTSYHSMRPIKFNKEPIKFFQSSFYLPVCLCFAGKKSTCASDPIGDGEFSECSLTNWPSVSQWADIYKTTRGDTKSQPSRVGWAFLCDRSKERERPNFVVQVIWVSFSWPCMCSVTNQKSTDDRTCNAKTFQDGGSSYVYVHLFYGHQQLLVCYHMEPNSALHICFTFCKLLFPTLDVGEILECIKASTSN